MLKSNDANILVNSNKYLFWLYLIISCNYLGDFFSCESRNMLKENMVAKNLIGFLTFYFFIAISDKTTTYEPLKKFTLSVIVYLLFIMSTKMTHTYWVVLMILLSSIFIIQIFKEENRIPETTETYDSVDLRKRLDRINTINKTQKILAIGSLIILLLGFSNNIYHKSQQFGDDFSILSYFFSKNEC